ncbi:MAG TPA: hydantoinase/oxoprolinase family protein [Actinomycetota bacterium]|nr:hydantoinase/oxoprolinase family protein [Actinomycetota bacterium]
MAVRIGVDVGGTFTKAVACAASTGEVVARAVVPTTHASTAGVAEGVIAAVDSVVQEVRARELGPVLLVSHSTTQAVNALLEGDTAIVGVVGIGRRPDLKRAARRTAVGEIRLAPGRTLGTRHAFIDATDGIDRDQVRNAIRTLLDEGAEVICASEAFGVEDARAEWMVLEVAADLGVPACAGHELTGLYGLEMRTVTAALNASILSTAMRTARLVEEAVTEDIPGVPLLVMRGDGGAADLETMKRHPLVTAFSGPSASVAGALRHLAVHDGVVVEVGGTSTNVSAVKGGRPILDYVRVLDHVTCVRSLDVRVVGVAGGSLLRLTKRRGRMRFEDIGPRSAHIAGLPYAAFADPEELRDARPRLISPRPGDPADYVVLESVSGRRFAVTLTCAANALGAVPPGAYALGRKEAAAIAFDRLGELIGVPGESVARRAVDAAVQKVAAAVRDAMADGDLVRPRVVGLGGGAGALVPALGAALGLEWGIPREAEVISSVGDALSLVRVEVERALTKPTAEQVAEVHADVERAAVEAGADPSTIQVESEALPERGALRAIAFGSLALDIDHTHAAPADEIERAARNALGDSAHEVARTSFYTVFAGANGRTRRFAVIDSRGALALEGAGTVISGTGAEVAAAVSERVPTLVRHYGPLAVAPAVRVLRGSRLIDLTLFSSPDKTIEAACTQCSLAGSDPVVALLSRD